jgi:hypothetical protein
MSSPLEKYVRIALALIGIIGALFAPWWLAVTCMVLLSLRFPAWEVPFIGLTIDLLWLPGDGFHIPVFTLLGILLVWLASPLRRQFLL